MRLIEYRPQQEQHPNAWMSHHCGFPLVLVIPLVNASEQGSGCQISYTMAAPDSRLWFGGHQPTSVKAEYRQGQEVRNALVKNQKWSTQSAAF
jgi:hypothetical protein